MLYSLREFMQFTRLRPHSIVLLCGMFSFTGFALAFLAARQKFSSERSSRPLVACLLTLSAFAFFVQLPLSIPLWHFLPQFQFVLFPFRFLPLLGIGCVFLLFSAGVSPRLRNTGVVLLLVQAVFPFFAFARLLPIQRFPPFAAAVSQWQQGFEGMREYVPSGVPHRRALPEKEQALHAQGPFASTSCDPSLLMTYPDRKVVTTHGNAACTLVLNTFYYPFWKAGLDGHSSLPVRMSPEGLLAVDVPQGLHQVTLRFVPATRARTVSAIASLIALLLLLVSLALPRQRSRPFTPASTQV